AMNAVSRILVEGVRCPITKNPLAGYPRFRASDGIGVFKSRRAQNGSAMFPCSVNHLPRLREGTGERPVDQVGQARFEVGLMKNVVPRILVMTARDDPVDLPQHGVGPPHG